MSYSKLSSWADINRKIRTTVIEITPGSNNVLRDAVDSVDQGWCTETDPYTISMGSGAYNEIQIVGKNYLTIQGAGVGSTVIDTDGLRTDVDPVSGVAYNLMAKADKHGIYGHYDITFRDLTWGCSDVKYVIHSDGGGNPWTMLCAFCRFEHSSGYIIGMGCMDGQTHTFQSCYIKNTGSNLPLGTAGSHGFLWHNENARSGPATLVVEDCTFENCGVLILQELESGQSDSVTVTNCTTNDNGASKGIYIIAASDALAYNIEITQNGGTMPAFAFDAVNRPLAEDHYTLVP